MITCSSPLVWLSETSAYAESYLCDREAVPEHTLEAARLMHHASTLVLPDTQHPFDAVDLNVLLPHLRAFWGLEVEE